MKIIPETQYFKTFGFFDFTTPKSAFAESPIINILGMLDSLPIIGGMSLLFALTFTFFLKSKKANALCRAAVFNCTRKPKPGLKIYTASFVAKVVNQSGKSYVFLKNVNNSKKNILLSDLNLKEHNNIDGIEITSSIEDVSQQINEKMYSSDLSNFFQDLNTFRKENICEVESEICVTETSTILEEKIIDINFERFLSLVRQKTRDSNNLSSAYDSANLDTLCNIPVPCAYASNSEIQKPIFYFNVCGSFECSLRITKLLDQQILNTWGFFFKKIFPFFNFNSYFK